MDALKQLKLPGAGVTAPASNFGQCARAIFVSLVAGAHAVLMLRRYRAWWRKG